MNIDFGEIHDLRDMKLGIRDTERGKRPGIGWKQYLRDMKNGNQ